MEKAVIKEVRKIKRIKKKNLTNLLKHLQVNLSTLILKNMLIILIKTNPSIN